MECTKHSRKSMEGRSKKKLDESSQKSLAEAEPLPLTSGLTHVFAAQRDNSKAYYLDGDVTMYTEAAIARRNALKADPVLQNGINDFISLYQPEEDGCIGRKEYDRIYHKLCNILRPGMDPLEKKKLMDDEWKKDSQGTSKMSREMLFDSLFELCDVWCPTIDVREYKAFFEQLKFRIKYEGQQDAGAYDILK